MVDKATAQSPYNNIYKRFRLAYRYIPWRQRYKLKHNILKPLGIQPPARILDLGCGVGYQTAAFAKLGYDATGIDLSSVGIGHAKRKFPYATFHAMDAAKAVDEFGTGAFDLIYNQGMSWYHYELTGVNKHGVDVPAATAEFFRLLKPGGVFVLKIVTDFSGSKTKAAVHYNELDDYVSLFEPHGEIVMLTNFKGTPLRSSDEAKRVGNGIVIATRVRES